MTPQQALAILDQATRRLKEERDIHLQIMQALQVLAEALAPKTQPPQQ